MPPMVRRPVNTTVRSPVPSLTTISSAGVPEPGRDAHPGDLAADPDGRTQREPVDRCELLADEPSLQARRCRAPRPRPVSRLPRSRRPIAVDSARRRRADRPPVAHGRPRLPACAGVRNLRRREHPDADRCSPRRAAWRSWSPGGIQLFRIVGSQRPHRRGAGRGQRPRSVVVHGPVVSSVRTGSVAGRERAPGRAGRRDAVPLSSFTLLAGRPTRQRSPAAGPVCPPGPVHADARPARPATVAFRRPGDGDGHLRFSHGGQQRQWHLDPCPPPDQNRTLRGGATLTAGPYTTRRGDPHGRAVRSRGHRRWPRRLRRRAVRRVRRACRWRWSRRTRWAAPACTAGASRPRSSSRRPRSTATSPTPRSSASRPASRRSTSRSARPASRRSSTGSARASSGLMRSRKIAIVRRRRLARAPSAPSRCKGGDGSTHHAARHATSSWPPARCRALIPGFEVDGPIMTSDEVLMLDRIPARMAVIGGGAIGCEFASDVRRPRRRKVTILEGLPKILPGLRQRRGQRRRAGVQEAGHRRSGPA